jgi:hypothetical protein
VVTHPVTRAVFPRRSAPKCSMTSLAVLDFPNVAWRLTSDCSCFRAEFTIDRWAKQEFERDPLEPRNPSGTCKDEKALAEAMQQSRPTPGFFIIISVECAIFAVRSALERKLLQPARRRAPAVVPGAARGGPQPGLRGPGLQSFIRQGLDTSQAEPEILRSEDRKSLLLLGVTVTVRQGCHGVPAGETRRSQ